MLTYAAPIGQPQNATTFQYFYDSNRQLIKVIDSAGIELDYTYDSVGNILQITRGSAPASGSLAILNFNPQSAGIGTVITIQGQNFSTTPASNTVTFNGAPATVLSATSNTLTAAVPATATTGPISVTVAGQTAKSTTNFTFIAGPVVLSVSPPYFVTSSSAITVPNFQVTGTGFTGATFSFAPAFNPPPITVNSAATNANGTAATLSLTIAPETLGSFALIATNSGSPSTRVPSAANTLQIISPDGDADGDGLTNIVEIAIGTNPLNPNTSGDGLPDGWQLFYELNPLDPTVAQKDYDGSGLTALQDFQRGLSPRNPNLIPPAVSQTTPKNGAMNIFVNDVVVARFTEPLLTGTSLAAAQSAITKALGSNSTVSASSQQIAAQTLQAYMNRTCCGNSAIAGTVTLTGPAGAVAGGVTPSADGLSVTFAPSRPLQSNTNYSIQVLGVRDLAGNRMITAYTSSFKTGSSLDQTAPQITSTNPVDGASNVSVNVDVAVTFSIAIDPASVAPGSVAMTDTTSGLSVSGLLQVDPTNTIVTFVPSAPLATGHSFSVNITTAIRDLGGIALLGNANFGFTTGGISQEVDGLTFSLLNGNVIHTSTQMESDSLTFSLLNGRATIRPTQLESDSLTFSLLNGVGPATGPTQHESDSLTFSLLNGEGPALGPTQREADSLTFSLLNGETPPSPSLPAESDSLTFSLLNGEPPPGGAITYEADSLTFSLHNTATQAKAQPHPRNSEIASSPVQPEPESKANVGKASAQP